MPKFIVNSTGDQYFPPDSAKFYFHDLQGVKYLRYVPNTNHSLAGPDAGDSILALYQASRKDAALPRFPRQLQPAGSIRVQPQDQPLAASRSRATTPTARDCRLERTGRCCAATSGQTSSRSSR